MQVTWASIHTSMLSSGDTININKKTAQLHVGGGGGEGPGWAAAGCGGREQQQQGSSLVVGRHSCKIEEEKGQIFLLEG